VGRFPGDSGRRRRFGAASAARANEIGARAYHLGMTLSEADELAAAQFGEGIVLSVGPEFSSFSAGDVCSVIGSTKFLTDAELETISKVPGSQNNSSKDAAGHAVVRYGFIGHDALAKLDALKINSIGMTGCVLGVDDGGTQVLEAFTKENSLAGDCFRSAAASDAKAKMSFCYADNTVVEFTRHGSFSMIIFGDGTSPVATDAKAAGVNVPGQ
jgi:hypothetical protein